MPDPSAQLNFSIEVDGCPLGAFTKCDGLQAEYEILPHEEGGENGFVHQLPGRLKYTNVKLTRPIDESTGKLAKWFAEQQQKRKPSDAVIKALDTRRKTIAAWSLTRVVPVRWSGPSFAADGSTVATETLELAHHGIEWAAVTG